MNTYLIPFADDVVCDILCVKASNYSEAKEKAVNKLANKYESVDYASDFDEAVHDLAELGIAVGDIYDIEEFN